MGNASAIREDCCPQGEVARADPKYFRKHQEEVEPEWGNENGDEHDDADDGFEHLGVRPQRRAPRTTAAQKNKSRSTTAISKRSLKAGRGAGGQAASRRGGRSAVQFDHEASFAEGYSEADGHSPRSKSSRIQKSEDSKLVQAIKKGKYEEMATILASHPQAANEADHYRQTPIFYISAVGTPEALQTLIDAKAEVSCANKFGYTPLMRALRHGRVDMAEELLKYYADPMARDGHKCTPLQVAAVAGQPDAVEWLLRQEGVAKLLDHKDQDGITTLVAASQKGHAEVCRLLLEARAGPDCTDEKGRTPLLFSLARNDIDLAQSLLDAGATVNTEDEDGRTVLHFLVENYLRFKDRKDIRDHSLCGIAAALEANADVDSLNSLGQTALCMAVKQNDPVLVALLAAYGADGGITDGSDHTLVVTAKKKGFIDCEKVLTEFCSVKMHKSPALNRGLLRAVFYGNEQACKGLLEKGAEHSIRSNAGQSLVEVAQSAGSSFVVVNMIRGHMEKNPAEGHGHGNAKGKDPEDRFNRWIVHLRETGLLASRMQRGIRDCLPDDVVQAVVDLAQSKIPEDEDDGSIAATMLSRFLVSRKSLTLRKAHTELRRLRAKLRRRMMVGIAKSLEEWDKAEIPDRTELMDIAAVRSAEVKTIKASGFELQDKYAKKLEDFQVTNLADTLRLCSELPPIYGEILAAREGFPQLTDMELQAEKLQCPKCMQMMPTQLARDKHVDYCKSKAGEDLFEERRMKHAAKADSAIHRIESAGMLLLKKADACTSVMQSLKAARKAAQKDMPEAVTALQGAYVLMQALHQLCLRRGNKCYKESWDAKATYGLHKPDDGKFVYKWCVKCFVKPVARACSHMDDQFKPCRCVCAACAFHLSAEQKAGLSPPCPACGNELKDFHMVKGLIIT